MYDIIFISYNESNADENFARLTARFPLAKRVTNVQGIHNAHIAAAKKSMTKLFWVVDGDAIIVDSFKFDHIVNEYDMECVHVWRSRNPVSRLEYGYGGVKLLPKKLTLAMDISSIDMTTSISSKFKAMEEISNITAFNTDPLSAWRSAFRECVKLSSRIVVGQIDTETEERLIAWCTLNPVNDTVPHGFYAYLGAFAGRTYGKKNAGNIPALAKINDFNWIKSQFEQVQISLEAQWQ